MLASRLRQIDYVWTINNWVDTRTEEDWTSGTLSTAVVDFEYDDRGRLISEERTVGQTDVYDLAYTYDQLGNRQTKVDAVSGQWVVYDYDVDLADPNTLDYPTWHNRLLEYRMYDRDPNDPNTILLRTVSYTYYKTGQASNITVKDEDPDPDPVNGPDAAYDVYHDLALYYHSHGPLWRALWGSYTLDQSGDPTGYETSWAREFFYDSPRQRFLAADYNTNGYDDEPDRWTWNTGLWTEYSGELPYADLETTRYLPDEQNHPRQHAYTRTETLHYLGTAAQQTTDTPPETAFHHGDLIGSTNLTTDDSGDANQTPAVAYTAFGEIIGDASTLATRYQYAGRFGYESDLLAVSGVNTNLADITLQHVGERWYQPDIGRFVQRDPIGIHGSLNAYAYCMNEPLASIDPDGLFKIKVRVKARVKGKIPGFGEAEVEVEIEATIDDDDIDELKDLLARVAKCIAQSIFDQLEDLGNGKGSSSGGGGGKSGSSGGGGGRKSSDSGRIAGSPWM